jgi:hypothetical protein
VTPGVVRASARLRPGSGGSFPRRCGGQGRGVRLGCAGAPTAGFVQRAVGPARGSHPGLVGVPWCSGRSTVLYQASVPGEQGAGRHDPMQAKALGQQPRQCGNHGAVGPVRLRAGNLTTQDRNLVPQHQDLYILRGVAPPDESQPVEPGAVFMTWRGVFRNFIPMTLRRLLRYLLLQEQSILRLAYDSELVEPRAGCGDAGRSD